jgi:hypothetical protein
MGLSSLWQIGSDLFISNIVIHQRDGSRWIAAPCVLQFDKCCTLKTDRKGKLEYTQMAGGAHIQAWRKLW